MALHWCSAAAAAAAAGNSLPSSSSLPFFVFALDCCKQSPLRAATSFSAVPSSATAAAAAAAGDCTFPCSAHRDCLFLPSFLSVATATIAWTQWPGPALSKLQLHRRPPIIKNYKNWP